MPPPPTPALPQLSRTRCTTPGCGYVSRSFEPFSTLQLPIPESTRTWRVRLVATCLVYPLRRQQPPSPEDAEAAVALQKAMGALPLVSGIALSIPQSAAVRAIRAALCARVAELLRPAAARAEASSSLNPLPGSPVGVCALPFDVVLAEVSFGKVVRLLSDADESRYIRNGDIVAYALTPTRAVAPGAPTPRMLPVYMRRRRWMVERAAGVASHLLTRRAPGTGAGPIPACKEAELVLKDLTIDHARQAAFAKGSGGAAPLHFHPVRAAADAELAFRRGVPDFLARVEVPPAALPLLIRVEVGDRLGDIRSAALLWARLHWDLPRDAAQAQGAARAGLSPVSFGPGAYAPELSWLEAADHVDFPLRCGLCSAPDCLGCPMSAITVPPQQAPLWPEGVTAADLDAACDAISATIELGDGGSGDESTRVALRRRQTRDRLAVRVATGSEAVGGDAAAASSDEQGSLWRTRIRTPAASLPASLSVDWFSSADLPESEDRLLLQPVWAAYEHLWRLREALLPAVVAELRKREGAGALGAPAQAAAGATADGSALWLPDPMSVVPAVTSAWPVAGMQCGLPVSPLLSPPSSRGAALGGKGGRVMAAEDWGAGGTADRGFGADPVTLERCLDLYAPRGDGTPLGADNLWTCPRCRLAVSALQAMVVVRPPEVLTVVLKRFQQHVVARAAAQWGAWGEGGATMSAKVDTPVSFGLELCLDPWVLESQQQHAAPASVSGGGASGAAGAPPPPGVLSSGGLLYDLFAVVHHAGTLRGGHYTAHARHPLSGTWYHHNDAFVTPSLPPGASAAGAGNGVSGGRQDGASEALLRVLATPAAYVLLYRRRRGTAADEAARRSSEAQALEAVLASHPGKPAAW